MSTNPPSESSNPQRRNVPGSRLFKVLNPELYMKPNRLIMYGGVAAMAGIIIWLGSSELKHRQEQIMAGNGTPSSSSNNSGTAGELRVQTYQERMAELRRSSS